MAERNLLRDYISKINTQYLDDEPFYFTGETRFSRISLEETTNLFDTIRLCIFSKNNCHVFEDTTIELICSYLV